MHLSAEPVPVRRIQGSLHGFLVLKSLEGKSLAAGDLVQVVHDSRVTSGLTYHFRDGSLDEETTVFTQSGTFASAAIITCNEVLPFPIRSTC